MEYFAATYNNGCEGDVKAYVMQNKKKWRGHKAECGPFVLSNRATTSYVPVTILVSAPSLYPLGTYILI